MSSMAVVRRVLGLSLVMGVALVASTEAAVISIVPNTIAVNVGDPVDFDVVVSGLAADEAVGGVAIQLTGDGSILDGVDFVLDPDNKMGDELDFFSGFGPGTLDLVFIAEDFGAPGPADDFAALKALQGTGFRLATVSLLAIAPGISPIAFVDAFGGYLSSAVGLDVILPVQTQDGLVCVGANFADRCAQVPEPGLISLFAAGLATLAVRRRRKS